MENEIISFLQDAQAKERGRENNPADPETFLRDPLLTCWDTSLSLISCPHKLGEFARCTCVPRVRPEAVTTFRASMTASAAIESRPLVGSSRSGCCKRGDHPSPPPPATGGRGGFRLWTADPLLVTLVV